MTLGPLFTWCEVCGDPDGVMTTRQNQADGLPVGVRACEDCRQAVRDHAVGIVIRPTGELYVTDGRHLEEATAESTDADASA